VAINRNRRTAIIFLFLDLLSVAVIFNVVVIARLMVNQPLLWPLVVPALIFVVILHLIDGYGAQTDMLSLDYASIHTIASAFAAFATLFCTFALIPSGFELRSSRSAIVVSFSLIGAVTLAYRRVIYERNVASRGLRKIVFVGNEVDFELFQAECQRLKTNKPLVRVYNEDNYAKLEALLDPSPDLKSEVEAIVIKESVTHLPADMPMKLMQLYFSGVPTYTLELFHQVYWRKIPLYRINPTWLFQEGFRVARDPVFEHTKRVADTVAALLGLFLSVPVIALAAIAIKLDDGGSIFFRQQRVGKHRVKFGILKLRTMRESSATEALYTSQGDSRITRVGRILRSARLDELPQLWNVLRGNMSLIGPRAEWDVLVEKYEKEIPCYHFRHLVKPGITGWAQVCYRYGMGVEDTLRKLEYDLYYIRNFSFTLDASIVLKTLQVMVLQKGH